MIKSLEYPYWYVAVVGGSLLNIAAFMLIPSLGYNKPVLDVPVLMVDFMEWREPVAKKVTKSVPVQPVKKSEIKPEPRPKPPVNKTEVKPVIVKKTLLTEKVVESQPAIIEEEPEDIPIPLTEPAAEEPPETKETLEDILPTPVPVFKLTSMPRFVHRAQFYPPSMRSLGKGAIVKLEVLIDKSGLVRNVRVLESAGDIFDQAAIDSIKASTFIPGNVEGKAVAVLMRMPVKFRLQ